MFKPKDHHIDFQPSSVSIQGQFGSFSHEAVTRLFPNIDEAAVYCFDNFEDPMRRVAAATKRDVAVIPVANTIAMNVPYVFQLLEDSKVSIIGEFFLGVQFHLATLPHANALDVREVHSHPHALAQCRGYIDRHASWCKVVNPDTAGAAKMVSEQDDKSIAAISSAFAAHRYGLKIADRHVQDAKDPITRFLVLHRDEGSIVDINDNDGRLPRHRFVTNMFLKPKRKIDRPETAIMTLFAEHLGDRAEPRIERYTGTNFRHEGFLVEFMGHYDEPAVKALWSALDKVCSEAVGVGCYKAHHFHRFPHRAGRQLPDKSYVYG